MDSPHRNQLLQKVGAEMVGTFALVFAGCGAIMTDSSYHQVSSPLGVSLVFGLVIMVMIYATGHISGAHFNPAVTLAFAFRGRFAWSQAAVYIAGQVLAAVLAAAALRGMLGNSAHLGATLPGSDISPYAALGCEFALSFLLMFVIAGVATDSRAVGEMAGLAVGGTVALAAFFGGPISGASMNPARSIGPALVSGEWSSLWIYLLAPPLGALAGLLTYERVQCHDNGPSEVGGCC